MPAASNHTALSRRLGVYHSAGLSQETRPQHRSTPLLLQRCYVAAWRPWLFAVCAAAVGLGIVLVLPAPFAGWTVNPGDLSWFRWPWAPAPPVGLAHPTLGLASDWVDVFGPDQAWMANQLLNGHLPLWNDLTFGGWPQFASQQTAMLSPFTWFTLLSTEQGTTLSIVAKVAVAASGTWLFARALGMSVQAAALSALTFAAGAYFLDWIFHPHTAVYAWMPWVLYGLTRLFSKQPAPRHAVIAAAGMTLMWISGHPQSAAICTAFCVAFAARSAVSLRPSRAVVWIAILAIVGGALTAAVQLLPLLDMLKVAYSTSRGGRIGAPPVGWLGIVVPDWWGVPSERAIDAYANLELPNYFERTMYLGIPALVLAAVGALRARHWATPILIGTLVVCSVFVVDMGALSTAANRLPGIASIGMTRTLVVVSLVLSVLAGLGYDVLRRNTSRRLVAVTAVVTAMLIAFMVISKPSLPAGAHPVLGDPFAAGAGASEAAGRALLRFALFAAATVAILWASHRWQRCRGRLLPLLLVITLVDLVFHGRALLPQQPTDQAFPPATPEIGVLAKAQGDSRVVAGPLPTLHPDVASRYGVRDLRGRGLPIPRRLFEAWKALSQPVADNGALFDPNAPESQRFLAFGAIPAFLTITETAIPGTRLVHRGSDGFVYAVTHPTSRASVVSAWESAADEHAAVRELRVADIESLRDRPVIETAQMPPAVRTSRAVPAQIELAGANRVVVRLPRRASGYLLLRDTYAAGWTAKVDGRRAEIVPANVTQRAVAVPAGARVVEFRYAPRSLYIGAALSLVGLLTVAATTCAWWWQRRRARLAEPLAYDGASNHP